MRQRKATTVLTGRSSKPGERDLIRRRNDDEFRAVGDFANFDQKPIDISKKRKDEIPEIPDHKPKTTPNYRRLQEDVDFLSRIEDLISNYDDNHTRRCQQTSQEYRQKVLDPLQREMKKELTGDNYKRRRQLMQPDKRQPPKNIDPILLVSEQEDRTTRRKQENLKEKKMERRLTGKRVSELPSSDRCLENDRLSNTRFFDGGYIPNKGTKVFESKYRSRVDFYNT